MSDTKTIQAAVEKLEGLRDASWSIVPGRWTNEEDAQEIVGSHGAIGECWNSDNADLIVTLHATIDAQLALLKLALEYGQLADGEGSRFSARASDLARAILGEQVGA
jgi:hypothetical protein